jgi:hypothetical protein
MNEDMGPTVREVEPDRILLDESRADNRGGEGQAVVGTAIRHPPAMLAAGRLNAGLAAGGCRLRAGQCV